MKKLILLAALLILFSSCRSKHAVKQDLTIQQTQTDTAAEVTAVVEEKKVVTETVAEKKVEKKETEKETEKVISGSVEPDQPFTYTESDSFGPQRTITITGKADFTIKEKTREEITQQQIKEASSSLTGLVESAKKSSEKTSISDFSLDLENNTKEVQSRGVSAPVYVIVGLTLLCVAVVGTVCFFLYRKFGGGVKDFLNRKRKNYE